MVYNDGVNQPGGNLTFTEKNYEVICSGCGKVHIVRSAFLASSMYIQKRKNGPAYPVHSCGDCPGEKIRTAWSLMQGGMPLPWQTKAILLRISAMNKSIWNRDGWGAGAQQRRSERARVMRDRLIALLAASGHRPKRVAWAVNFELES